MSSSEIPQLGILVILLFLSGFFSSAETALTTVNRIKIRSMADQGNAAAKRVLSITEQSAKMLSAILIGNNIVNISASSLATSLTMHFFGNGAVAISTGIMTLLVLVFGEITPKTMAAANAEALSLRYCSVIYFLMQAMTPLIFIVDKLSAFFVRLLRSDSSSGEESITEEELRTLLDMGQEEGAIESEERRMINNVFDFGDDLAKEVMIPAPDIVTVDDSDSYEAIREVFLRDKFTRLPVTSGNRDHITGILNIKDFLFIEDPSAFDIHTIMYEPHFTYEQKKISELFLEMRQNAISLTIVLDEYGTVAGMITMEDLLEELVGEIRDEFDREEEDMIKDLGSGEYLAKGVVRLDDLNERLGTSLHSDDYDSLGGYIIEALDHLPAAGEVVETADGDLFKVEKMHRKRIETVRIYMHRDVSGDSES